MLFLQESATTDKLSKLSLEEAQAGLLEAVMHMGALTEAAMQADFSIYVSTKQGMLSEAASEEKKEGLFAKVVARAKELLRKAKDHIVRIFNAIVDRLRRLWARITGKNGLVSVTKGGIALIGELDGAFAKYVNEVQGSASDAAAFSEKASKAKETWTAASEKVSAAVEKLDKTAEKEMVKVGQLSKIQASANKISAVANTAKSALEKDIKELEKLEKQADFSDADKEVLALARARNTAYSGLTSAAATVASRINAVIHGV